MNKIKAIDKFGLKEVPDIFFINTQGKIVYCIDTIKEFKSKYLKYGKWEIQIKSPIFHKNIPLFWENKDEHYDIYCRTYKRNFETGKDQSLCMKFNNAIFESIIIDTAAEGEPCEFPMLFITDNMEFINNDKCPELVLSEEGIKKLVYPIKEEESQD